MSRFSERLWGDLVREHGAGLADISRPSRQGGRARPRLLAGGTVGLAGLGTIMAFALSAASSSPAFAVSKNRDGTVTVVIRKLDAIGNANARLAALGLRARFVQVAPGCAAPPRGALTASLRRDPAAVRAMTLAQGDLHARFDPRRIPAGQTLVVGAWGSGRRVEVIPAHVVRGGAPGCLPVPASAARAIATVPPGAAAQAALCARRVKRAHR